MAYYITTIKFTPQGVKGIDDTIRRAETFKAEAKKHGVKVVDVYWTMGDYDGLLILEAADGESAAGALLHLASLGNVHTTTVQAFRAADMEKVLKKVKAG
jgi:uncharacterized protein with GYD domain